MSQEVTTTETREVVAAERRAPAVFDGRQALGMGANVGAVAIEQERAIAEAQGKMVLAKRFPRSLAEAREELAIACASMAFAESAFYSVPNRGSGPSIRFAEEVARVYGNFDYGHRELSREVGDGTKENPGKSEVEVYAWDMEKNNYSRRQITVLHMVDTKQGPKVLRDQADIDNRIANIASKQVRGRILALMSKALVAEGIELCKATIAGKGSVPIAVSIQRMQSAFSHFGVTVEMLEKKLGHKLESTNADEIADMRGIINDLKEGGKVSDHFGGAAEEEEKPQVEGAKPAPKATTQAKAKEADKPKEPEKPKAEPKAEAKPPETEKPKEAEKPQEAAQEASDDSAATTTAKETAGAAEEASPAAETGSGEEGEDVF